MSSYKTGRRLFNSISLLLRRRASETASTGRHYSPYQNDKWVWPIVGLVFGGGGYMYLRSRDQRTFLLPQVTANEGKEDKGEVKVVSNPLMYMYMYMYSILLNIF